ncbi:hypothetical protein LENED_012080 [Lentinula edodes]|uniref:Protein kinase domain-containing protein n=1 Tax=Lentinula edodes TaxID=5353 RepID=A0A1Q3ERR3_LENED|nr:hypothetical protein LENED_012080 [Lentinula edodes]
MFNAEEVSLYGSIMDAVRISDNKPVMLKAVSRIIHPQEVKIGMYFSDKSIASDPRNHCIPIYDVFPVADSEMDLIVMPVLRPFENPQFDTVGEVIAFIQQLLEGIQFMHEHLVAHGDEHHDGWLPNVSQRLEYPGSLAGKRRPISCS